MACFNGHLDIVEDIIKRFPNLINNRNEFGQSPLWLASHSGSFKVVKYLIEQGANITNERALDVNQNIQNDSVSDTVNTMFFMSRASFESPLIPSCTGMAFLHLLSCKCYHNIFIFLNIVGMPFYRKRVLQKFYILILRRQPHHCKISIGKRSRY